MDLAAYCHRIGYHGPLAPTLDVLRAVTACHPQAIAFEAIAVTAGGVPEIGLPAVTRKLLGGARGGYCYEQNTLLRAALSEIGFAVRPLAARVLFGKPPGELPARSHMVLRVDLPDGPYLADAGFGGVTLTGPVPLRFGAEERTPHETVRLVPAGEDWRLQALIAHEWADVYQFDEVLQHQADYEQQNWYTATRPGSLFANHLVATRPVPGGRYTLFDTLLKWRPLGGVAETHAVIGADALASVLHEVFGLTIPRAEVEAAAKLVAR